MSEGIEFIDCGTLSISYDATGKVTVSFTVIRDDSQNFLDNTYTEPNWGGVQFGLIVMRAAQQPIIGSGGWCQWQMQLEGVGNK